MSIRYEILGLPGADNAMYLTIEDGQSRSRLLFDCGQGVLDTIGLADIQRIEAVFFSHFHFDHFAGFDSFFRNNWCRPDSPVRIFGPAGTCHVLHHRLRGFLWNNASGLPGEFLVSEFDGEVIRTIRLLTTDRFENAFPLSETVVETPGTAMLYATERFTVDCCVMDHGTDSLSFITQEKPSMNIDVAQMRSLGLSPGPWVRVLKESVGSNDSEITVDGRTYLLSELRNRLLNVYQGDSVAYLTDFSLNDPVQESRLLRMLSNCQMLVCENNYLDTEAELAHKNHHLTTSQVANLARQINADLLVLFHLSDRYQADKWAEQLSQMRALFPRTVFPPSWEINPVVQYE